jgi:FkbM family methyltransferase
MKDMLNKIMRVVDVLGQKDIFKYIYDIKNFSVSSTILVSNIKKYVHNVDTIIDVGANRGQFLFSAEKAFPNAQIYSFEPIYRLYSSIKNKIKNQNLNIFNLAISSKDGDIIFYESNYSHISSALKIDLNNKNPKYADAKVIERKVASYSLSTFFKEKQLIGSILLKIDAQGLEKDILVSAGDFLQKIDYLVLELAFEELYKEQSLFAEIHGFLAENGFIMVAPLDFHKGNQGCIIEADILYRRKI